MEEAGVEVTAQKAEKKLPIVQILVFLLVLAVIIIIFLFSKINSSNISGNSFKYIQPLQAQPIDSDSGNGIIQYGNLKPLIEEEIAKYNSTGDVGIYLQDAKTGAWLGINEKMGFAPASLLKLPVMIEVLKKVERGEMNLNDKIELTQKDLNSEWGTLYQQGAGAKVTVENLLEEMIASSDNTAKNALLRQLSATEIDSVFVHVGITDPYLLNTDQTVSPRGYIRLFKALYYSTYLSPKYSELGIELTTDGKEENLISQGVPSEVQVAHKFGIIEKQGFLHDCGIVYHQINPYFLCIMTQDIDFSKSKELIPKISKDIYDFIDNNSK